MFLFLQNFLILHSLLNFLILDLYTYFLHAHFQVKCNGLFILVLVAKVQLQMHWGVVMLSKLYIFMNLFLKQ